MASRDGDGRVRGRKNTALSDENEEMASLIRGNQDLRNEVSVLRQQVESLTRMLGLTSTWSGAAHVLRQEGGEAQASAVTAAVPRPDFYDSNGDNSNVDEFLSILGTPQEPPELRMGHVESQELADNQQHTNEANRSHESSPLFTTPKERRREGGLGLEAHAGGGGGVTASPGGDIEGLGANQLQAISFPFATANNGLGEVQPQGLGVFAGAGGSDRVDVAPGGLAGRTAPNSNQTTPAQGTNNAIDDENDRKASAGISLYDRDTGINYPFQASAIFFFITSNLWSAEFKLAAMAVTVSVGIMVLAIIDAFKDGTQGNLLNIPAGVRAPVRVAQAFAAIVGILSEQESYQGVALLKFAIKKSLYLTGDRERIQVKQWKVFFASFCFLTVGLLFLINIVLSVIRADEVISLFFDILALEFVLNVDNLIYEICKYFPLVKDATRKVKKLELDRPAATQSPRNWRFRFTTRAFVVKVLGVFFSLSALCILQQVGKYTEKSIAVTFGDETWEQARVQGEDEPRVLLYSYFSGVYERDGIRNGYARYVEQNKENGRPFNDIVPAEIVYCPKMKSWVFTHPNIYKSIDEDEENCNWLMRSSKTDSFDIVEAAGDNWETWVGTIQTSTSLTIYSNECLSDEDCNFNGKCKKNTCICNTNEEDGTSLFFGRQCQLDMPCSILVTENVELGRRTQLLMVESDTTNEGFLKSYGRPIYTVTGLSGVPEALLSINPKTYGHSADRYAPEVVIDSGNKAFEDDDFFRESLKEFDENPLGDTLFDFGGTEISLRNYAVILAFSGSRWFATIDRPDFNVKDVYNADYHAFWQNTYSERTFLLSDTTSNGSPVGVEFFSPRRRKSSKDYGPFGILLPNSDIEGVGFFQCYANVGRCTFVDINVSTQNKSLPTNQGDYFSGDQIVSWRLDNMAGGSNKIEQESRSVLLGTKFTHRFCLADGAYTFAIADEVCKSSWWECQHGPGKSGYDISIKNVPVVEKYGIFRESKFTFLVMQGEQEVQEDKNNTFCPGLTNFNVTVYTDGSPYETSWHLINDAYDSPLLKGGPYPFYKTFTTLDHMACLTDGTYNFTMFDSGGDGMTPPGHYDIMVGDEYVVRGGHLFENSRSTPFSVVGGSLSFASRTYSTIASPTKHHCSEVLFDVLGSSFSSSVPQSQSEVSWSAFDVAQQAYVVQAQPLNRDDPKAPCLYEGVYTFTYEHLENECFGNGLSLFGSDSSMLFDGPICRNNTFAFLLKNLPNGHVDNEMKATFTHSSLERECMNDFHLVVSDDVSKGMSDGSWELYGKNGMILRGDHLGDSSSTYYNHHACLGPGTYNFVTWKHPASQYTLSYRQSTLSNVELDLDQPVLVGKRPVVIDNSALSISWTDIGNVAILGRSSNSEDGGWIVEGSGAGIGEKYDHMGNSDSFHYLYESFSEDVGLTIFIENFSANSNNQSMGGIMFRDSLGMHSRHYSMFLTGGNGLRNLYRRTCEGCETIQTDGANAGFNSVWLRVTKEGNWFTSYYKEGDSREWTQFGLPEYVRFSCEEFLVGIAVTSHDETITATIETSNVELVALREAHEYGLTLWEERKILPRDGEEGGVFGYALALDESTLVISGSKGAYVFPGDGEGWKEQAKVVPRDGAEHNRFGHALALDGNTILVGAPASEGEGITGSAYVFIRDGADWREQAKFVLHDGAEEAFFGWAVALDGQTVVIGDPKYYGSDLNSGSAHVFVRNGEVWTEQAKLVPHDDVCNDYFGLSVALSKDTILVGAPACGPDSGSAYVFIRSGEVWKEHVKLVPHAGAEDYWFGSTVALSGNIAVVDGLRNAYVFIHEEVWREQAKLRHREWEQDGLPVALRLALSENIVVIGDTASDDSGENSGSAHVFARYGEEWKEVDKLLPHDGALGDLFGHAVALDNDTLIITSFGNNDNGAYSGSAYIFTTPTSELIRAKTWSPPTAASPFSTASLPSLPPAAYCIGVNFGINVLTDDYPCETSWTLSRISNDEVMTRRNIFFRGSASSEKRAQNNYADVMCLERGDYEFTIYDSSGSGGYYNITVDGEAIARGSDFCAKETVSFTIPFVPSPSLVPSASLSPSDTPSTSSVPSMSSGPSSFPSASLSPSTSLIPTSSWSPSTPPSASTSPTSCFGVEINVFTDHSPEETSWMISRTIVVEGISSTEVVLEGSPGKKYSHNSDAMCLKKGNYDFTIYDDYGNGLYGDGYYNIMVAGKVIARGGEFEDKETVSFTIPFVPSPPPSVHPSSSPSSTSYPSGSVSPSSSQLPSISPSFTQIPTTSQVPSSSPSTSLSPTCSFFIEINILTDMHPQDTRWTLSEMIIVNGISSAEVVLEGSPENKKSHHTEAACLERGDYLFSIFDSYGDGIYWPGYYNITVHGNMIAFGFDFQDEEKVSFSIPYIQDDTTMSGTLGTKPLVITPDHSNQWFPFADSLGQEGEITFNVKARKDAHIALGSSTIQPNTFISNHYEVVIGGGYNSYSCLRLESLGSCVDYVQGAYLNGSEFRAFRVIWSPENLSLYRLIDDGWLIMLSMKLTPQYVIDQALVMTGWGASGVWELTSQSSSSLLSTSPPQPPSTAPSVPRPLSPPTPVSFLLPTGSSSSASNNAYDKLMSCLENVGGETMYLCFEKCLWDIIWPEIDSTSWDDKSCEEREEYVCSVINSCGREDKCGSACNVRMAAVLSQGGCPDLTCTKYVHSSPVGTNILTASPISSKNLGTRQPAASPTTSAVSSRPSPPSLCQQVEVGMSFNGLPAGSGWAITPLETREGAGSDTDGTTVHSFFPSDVSPADGGDVRLLCLGEGRYKFVAYNYVSDGGVADYYIESNGQMIWQGGEFELTEMVVFDIPFMP